MTRRHPGRTTPGRLPPSTARCVSIQRTARSSSMARAGQGTRAGPGRVPRAKQLAHRLRREPRRGWTESEPAVSSKGRATRLGWRPREPRGPISAGCSSSCVSHTAAAGRWSGRARRCRNVHEGTLSPLGGALEPLEGSRPYRRPGVLCAGPGRSSRSGGTLTRRPERSSRRLPRHVDAELVGTMLERPSRAPSECIVEPR